MSGNIFLTNIFIYLIFFVPFYAFIFQLPFKLALPISSTYASIFATWRILEVLRDESAASDWLASVESLLPITTMVPVHVLLLLVHLLVEDKGQNLRQILKVTTELAQADSCQVKKGFLSLLFPSLSSQSVFSAPYSLCMQIFL